MEPVFTVAHGYETPVMAPAPQHGPGQMEGQGRRGLRVGGVPCAVVARLLLFLGVTVGFAFAIYRGRHNKHDLAFAIVTYYLVIVFACCFAKLQQLRRDPASTAAELRRVRIAAWVVSAALGIAATLRVADAVHGLALKLVVWVVSIVLHGLGLYFLFLRKGANAARQPATALPGGLSPEEKV